MVPIHLPVSNRSNFKPTNHGSPGCVSRSKIVLARIESVRAGPGKVSQTVTDEKNNPTLSNLCVCVDRGGHIGVVATAADLSCSRNGIRNRNELCMTTTSFTKFTKTCVTGLKMPLPCQKQLVKSANFWESTVLLLALTITRKLS